MIPQSLSNLSLYLKLAKEWSMDGLQLNHEQEPYSLEHLESMSVEDTAMQDCQSKSSVGSSLE